jgi:hypothetical protein
VDRRRGGVLVLPRGRSPGSWPRATPLLHTTGGRQGVDSLPNDLDFAIALGLASEREVLDALGERDDPLWTSWSR